MKYRYFKAGLIFLVVCGAASVATAENVANPLYSLNTSNEPAACKSLQGPPSKSGIAQPISRDRLLCMLTAKAPPEISYADLRQKTGLKTFDPLLFALVPCANPKNDKKDNTAKANVEQPTADDEVEVANKSGTTESDTDQQKLPVDPYSLESMIKRCEPVLTGDSKADQILSPERRFDKKPNNLYIRQSLLALFQSAEYGKRNDFIVLRQVWEDETSELKSQEYRPLVDQFEDDIVVIRYLMGEPAFEVVRETNEIIRVADNATPNKAVSGILPNDETVWAPIMTGYASPFDRVWSIFGELDETQKFNMPKIGPTNHKPTESTAALQLAIVKASGEFAKGKPDAAKVGTTVNGATDGTVLDDDEPAVTADIAIGLPIKWSRIFDYEASRYIPEKVDFTVTPFISVDAQPQTVTSTIIIDGSETSQKRMIDTATLAVGLRFDYEHTSERRKLPGDVVGRDYLGKASRDIPGIKIGLVYEGLTDNYNLWSAERAGLELSPPSFFLTPGYRTKYPLDAWSRDRIKPGELASATSRNWVDGFLNGWYFDWDTAFALDYIDYSRLPRKFDEDFPIIERDDTPEYGLYGGNLEFNLTKRNLFGLSSDDAWASIEVDYTYRDGFKSDSRTTNHVEISLKLQDPAESKRFIGLSYKDGFNYRTQEDEDLFGLEFGAKY